MQQSLEICLAFAPPMRFQNRQPGDDSLEALLVDQDIAWGLNEPAHFGHHREVSAVGLAFVHDRPIVPL